MTQPLFTCAGNRTYLHDILYSIRWLSSLLCFIALLFWHCVLIACRAKIAACVARGGIPDRDCPSDEASMRFWCHLSEKETNRDKVKVKTKAQAQVAPGTMVDALGTAFLPQNVVHVANPAQMIANRVAPNPTASSSQPETPSPAPAGPFFF